MKNKYNNYGQLACLTLASIFICTSTQASVLTIKNEDTVDVHIAIEAGDGKLLGLKDNAQETTLHSGASYSVTVTKEHLQQEAFSVTGTVKIPSARNKCGPLLVDRNYKIIFTGAKTGGTVCVAEEVQ
jgi:hypothetical protein